MSGDNAQRLYELEESAQGADLFRAPGDDLLREDARDQAETSGWIPEAALQTWPSRLSRARRHHLTLREAMDRLERVVGRPVGHHEWHRSVDEALYELEESLEDHVEELESDHGLLADIERKAPRLSGETGRLREEHRSLSRTLEQARTTLRGSEAVGTTGTTRVRRRVMTLLGRLVLHRQRAADLVYDAYNVDIAASD